MLSIQDAGKSILSGEPDKFYAFVGAEYGVKQKYIRILQDHYGNIEQGDSVTDILSFFKKKHLIKPMPKLYVVRYDDQFISSLNKDTEKMIDASKIIGTIVCIYENEKDASKLAKYLPAHTVSIDRVADRFIVKYLMNDFPDLSEDLIKTAVDIKKDYSGAYAMCSELQFADSSLVATYTSNELSAIFTPAEDSNDDDFKEGIAARNFGYCISKLDAYTNRQDQLFYAILAVMIELEKGITSKNHKCMYGKYLNYWTVSDVYNMFMATYAELITSRNSSYYNINDGLIYLLSLLSSPVVGR